MILKTEPQSISPYLKDASNYTSGFAEKVIIPESLDELITFLKINQKPVTIAGAGTGMTASRIPESGLIISLEKFNELGIPNNGFIDVGPATTLAKLQKNLATTKYFYPPNPTEPLASIGGTLATNASGSRSYKYGVTRDYVIEADIVLANGTFTTLSRGLSINDPLILSDGQKLIFPNIYYQSPICKNAAGYYVRPGMDWLDLFIGSDGTLCIFTRIRLKLLPSPESFIAGILFFSKEEQCWELVSSIKQSNVKFIDPCSLEYFDKNSFGRLRGEFNNIPSRARAALFFENVINKQEDHEHTLDAWFNYLSKKNVLLKDSWIAQSPKDLTRFHNFRHAIPILINEENSRMGRVKIGTDMAVSDKFFMDLMFFYQRELSKSKLDFVIFGHLGDNHLHINLLPKPEEIDEAHKLYGIFVEQVIKWEGTVSAEHGIGKLKKNYFLKMIGFAALNDLLKIKRTIDPKNILGIGNLF